MSWIGLFVFVMEMKMEMGMGENGKKRSHEKGEEMQGSLCGHFHVFLNRGLKDVDSTMFRSGAYHS